MLWALPRQACFNTQPPEGGWNNGKTTVKKDGGFNTQPPEGGWNGADTTLKQASGFNTQPPEGGWMAFSRLVVNVKMFQHTAA